MLSYVMYQQNMHLDTIVLAYIHIIHKQLYALSFYYVLTKV